MKIKIAQIGRAHEHAAAKMRALRRLQEVFEVVAVVDDSASAAARLPDRDTSCYEGIPVVTEEDLFRIPGLQAVVVETANADLVPTALRVLEHRLPLHMDKPGGDDPALFARLRCGYEALGIPFQMGYMFRNNPAFQWIRKAVRNGWLGELFEVQGSMSHRYGGAPYQEYLGRLPGGIMFNLGCHLIDFVAELLGAPKQVISILKPAPGFPPHVANHTLAILDYPHATATIRACSQEVDGLSRRRLKVCGTRGSVELCPLERFDGKPLTMEVRLLEGNDELSAGFHMLEFGPVEDRYAEQFLEFACVIRGKAQPTPYNARHDLHVHKIHLAASGITAWHPE